jgi:hypothetical protein
MYCSHLTDWLKVGLPLILKLLFFMFEQLSLMFVWKLDFKTFYVFRN